MDAKRFAEVRKDGVIRLRKVKEDIAKLKKEQKSLEEMLDGWDTALIQNSLS